MIGRLTRYVLAGIVLYLAVALPVVCWFNQPEHKDIGFVAMIICFVWVVAVNAIMEYIWNRRKKKNGPL
jgi:uncharacterized membrane protein